jgi:hypothetical protein
MSASATLRDPVAGCASGNCPVGQWPLQSCYLRFRERVRLIRSPRRRGRARRHDVCSVALTAEAYPTSASRVSFARRHSRMLARQPDALSKWRTLQPAGAAGLSVDHTLPASTLLRLQSQRRLQSALGADEKRVGSHIRVMRKWSPWLVTHRVEGSVIFSLDDRSRASATLLREDGVERPRRRTPTG